jgi:hypothetical protein
LRPHGIKNTPAVNLTNKTSTNPPFCGRHDGSRDSGLGWSS